MRLGGVVEIGLARLVGGRARTSSGSSRKGDWV